MFGWSFQNLFFAFENKKYQVENVFCSRVLSMFSKVRFSDNKKIVFFVFLPLFQEPKNRCYRCFQSIFVISSLCILMSLCIENGSHKNLILSDHFSIFWSFLFQYFFGHFGIFITIGFFRCISNPKPP